MATPEQLREIERAVGFRYPATFVAAAGAFSALLGTDRFCRVFPDSRLLVSAPEVVALRETLPAALLPFLCGERASWPDIYAFELDDDRPEFRVVVWSGHAIVMDWPGFPSFLDWVHDRMNKHAHAA